MTHAPIGVVGAGTMGAGIAQVTAVASSNWNSFCFALNSNTCYYVPSNGSVLAAGRR
jgi:hypothetical protein